MKNDFEKLKKEFKQLWSGAHRNFRECGKIVIKMLQFNAKTPQILARELQIDIESILLLIDLAEDRCVEELITAPGSKSHRVLQLSIKDQKRICNQGVPVVYGNKTRPINMRFKDMSASIIRKVVDTSTHDASNNKYARIRSVKEQQENLTVKLIKKSGVTYKFKGKDLIIVKGRGALHFPSLIKEFEKLNASQTTGVSR